MSKGSARRSSGLTTRGSQPLIGILTREGKDDVVRYFTSEEEADRAFSGDQEHIQRALSAIGAWSDLDFDEMLDALDRIRHQSTPTPPLDVEL
jgi:hypothetical protein